MQGGLGLGLSIVRRPVEMHGESVRAEREGEGKGAKFTVTFPASTATPSLEATPTQSPLSAETGREA